MGGEVEGMPFLLLFQTNRKGVKWVVLGELAVSARLSILVYEKSHIVY